MTDTAALVRWKAKRRQVNTWLEPKDNAEIKRRAKRYGMSLSGYVRKILVDHVTQSEKNTAPLKPR